jgi:hypothetical protein
MLDPENYYAKQPPFTGNTVVEIDVPSGKLIAADSLCSVPHFNVEPPLSINYGVGLDAYAVLLAKRANANYAFVGNSSPVIARQADGSLEVISPEWGDFDEPVLNAGETIVARICTDLWATMLTDYQNWLDHGGPDIGTANDAYALEKYTVIEVPAGRHRWTVFSHADGFDMHAAGRVTYARLERIEGGPTKGSL